MALCVMASPGAGSSVSPRPPSSCTADAVANDLWSTPANERRGKRARSSDFDYDTAQQRSCGFGRPSERGRRRLSCNSTTAKAGASARCSLRIDIAATHRIEPRASTCVVRPKSFPPRVSSPLANKLAGDDLSDRDCRFSAGSDAGSDTASDGSGSPCASVASSGADSESAPLRRKRRRVRFGFGVKVHDGLCCANRIFDELVWEQVTTVNIASPDDVIRVVQAHLEREEQAARRASAVAPRNRACSAVSTDSDESEDGVPSLAQALTSLQRQTLDLGRRIAEADREASCDASSLGFGGSSSEVSVPVLPRGGGLAAKLTPRHLQLVMLLAEYVQEALEITTRTSGAYDDLSSDDLEVSVRDL